MYNWYVINTGKLCPAGWHIPLDADWTTLVSYLEGDPYAAEKLKESGSLHWNIGMMSGSNTSGFTALPAGIRDGIAQFNGVGRYIPVSGKAFLPTRTPPSIIS